MEEYEIRFCTIFLFLYYHVFILLLYPTNSLNGLKIKTKAHQYKTGLFEMPELRVHNTSKNIYLFLHWIFLNVFEV